MHAACVIHHVSNERHFGYNAYVQCAVKSM